MEPSIFLNDNKEEIENSIIDLIAEVSTGQLMVFKPTEEMPLVDLVVKKRGKYYNNNVLFLQVQKCRKEKGFFRVEIPKKRIIQDNKCYLLFVNFDEVSQGISDYLWLIPAIKFIEISETEKDKNLKFEVFQDVQKESIFSRFLVEKKDLPRVLNQIIEKGEKYIFSAPKLLFLNLTLLKNFIIEARRRFFADEIMLTYNPRLKGSKEFEYQKDDWTYHNICFCGKNNFIGQELIYYNNNPVWIFQYFGNPLEKKAEIFLKQTLFNLAGQCRFGGKYELTQKDFCYKDKGSGDIKRFCGEEKIFFGEKEIYKLKYQGGLV